MDKIGRYSLTRKLGEGNMGVVFAARDENLGRSVAIKLVQGKNSDPQARIRLMREARAAAAVNHPNICHIYEVGEHEGELYVAMELLDGEALSDRINRGPLAAARAVEVAVGVLDALAALHRASIVHRDLKPSNVFLTAHGVKLLDFGLARDIGGSDEKTAVQLTMPGTIVGTPRYMAPEQWAGSDVSSAADLFACGAMLFEMLTGKAAFTGETLPALCHAIVHGQPPALVGGADVQAVDRVINRALAKRPQDRYPDAASMAADLRSMPQQVSGTLTSQPRVRTVTRLMVLPFRLLRPDADIDFLPTSLADAVTASLCGLESLVVRSNRTAPGETDVRELAAKSGVDVVLTGNLLRASGQLRLTPQLIDARDGTVIWSKALQSSSSDIFQLQDELTAQLLDSLSVPLSRREQQMLERDAPATSRGYELYLRAIDVGVNSFSTSTLLRARDLFRESIQNDPNFAPAWARIARVYRIIAKYGHDDVEESRRLAKEAFAKALELNPDLPVAHNFFTYFEMEELADAPRAMKRLLGRLASGARDPDLYAGLVAACRFGGLYDASVAADQRARRLDPAIETSIPYTLWFLRDYQRLTEMRERSSSFMSIFGKSRLGLRDEAIRDLQGIEQIAEGNEINMVTAARAALEGDRETAVAAAIRYAKQPMPDPENRYFWSFQLAMVGEKDLVLGGLRESVERNFCCHVALEGEPEFDFLRREPEFRRIVADARERHEHAKSVFREAGGEQLLA